MRAERQERASLYTEVTNRIIAELEEGRLPWAQPWDSAACGCTMPQNAGTARRYSGINVLLLWAEGISKGYASQRWLTYRQAEAADGNVQRGEKGTVICYADRFTPKAEAEAARGEDREARHVAFLKRFVVFNVDQCEGLPEDFTVSMVGPDPVLAIAEADALIAASGATFNIGGGEAFYSPSHDFVQVPPQAAFHEPVNWYRTALHELGHWTGHGSRLDRDQKGGFGSAAYAKEELVAEMAAAFTCASLGIAPTVRHADYIASWLSVLRNDEKAIFRAASAASKAGRSVEEVADSFGFEPRAVKRILALGNLLPRIRTLYRGGEIDAGTVRHLTLASKSQQKSWLALFDDEGAYCPTGHQLKAWLFGGTAIAVKHALFDTEEAKLATVSDLFGEDSFFADGDAFWSAQVAAIEARKADYLEAGWSDVVIMARGDWFRSWDYVHAGKRKGGRIYVEVRESGEVTFHEGFVTTKEAKRLSGGGGSEDDDAVMTKPVRPEVSGPLNAYIDLHRHAAVRADLAGHGGVALRAMLAHVIAGADLWRVDVESQRAPKEDIAESVETSSAETAFDIKRRAVLAVLGFDEEAPTVTGRPMNRPPFAPLFARLLELPDPVVLEIVAIVMGETLQAGSEAVEMIGLHLGTDMRQHWTADAAFFDQLRDREVLLAVVGEVAGPEVAAANAGEKGKALKAIVADCLEGANGRSKAEPWVPQWMAFPPSAYTTRDGVGSVKSAASVRHDLAASAEVAAAQEGDDEEHPSLAA